MQSCFRRALWGLVAFAAMGSCLGDTNTVVTTNKSAAESAQKISPEAQRALAQRAEQVRMQCIEGRRYICGRVLQILPVGLVVDSGYTALLEPPFNRSWLVRGNVSVSRNPSLVEERRPDAVCVGPVLLTNIPKKPAVKPYDYVVIHGYPAGEQVYAPVPGVQKTVRRFSASLERAVDMNLAASEK